MKDDGDCIKACWDRFVESDFVEQKISPFGKMNIQLADLTSNTGISLHTLEKEFTYQDSLQPSKSKPEYWSCLGSSKSRSSEQEQLSREIIGELLEIFFFLIQFYVPFKLFHSYRDGSIGRWGENRSTRGKTT